MGFVRVPFRSTGALFLFLFSPQRTGAMALPENGRLTIGRSRDQDVWLDEPSVSRLHAEVSTRRDPILGSVITLTDLGSSNGTWVNGARLEPNRAQVIERGHSIQVGLECVLTIHERMLGPSAVSSKGTSSAPSNRARGVARNEADEARGPPFIASEPRVRELFALAERIAASELNILIAGETGTGKEVLSRFIHDRSLRANGPFIPLNCGAIAPTLLESELFGYVKGAFTGAATTKPGLCEAAEGGTLFLDEIGEMPIEMQVKMLRVLEDRAVWRIGAREPVPVNTRIIAATHRDLAALSDAGAFRRDLYYRLNGITLTLPPLRDRRADIPELARRFVGRAAESAGHSESPPIAPDAMSALMSAEWPGNIRQLKNVVECAFVLSGGGEITRRHLQSFDRAPKNASASSDSSAPPPRTPIEMRETWSDVPVPSSTRSQPVAQDPPRGSTLSEELGTLEKRRILDALESCGGNQTRAAKRLGMSRKKLLARLDTYGITRPRKTPSSKGLADDD